MVFVTTVVIISAPLTSNSSIITLYLKWELVCRMFSSISVAVLVEVSPSFYHSEWLSLCAPVSLIPYTASLCSKPISLVVEGSMGFPGDSEVKSLPIIRESQETWVQSLGKVPWRRAQQPTPVFLPGNPMDRGTSQAGVRRAAKSWT